MSNTDQVFLEGLALAGYKSFGEELQYMGPLSKVNIIIGQNNSGKSNILNFLAKQAEAIIKLQFPRNILESIDIHKGLDRSSLIYGIGLDIEGDNFKVILDWIETEGKRHGFDPQKISIIKSALTKIFETLKNHEGDSLSWFINGQGTDNSRYSLTKLNSTFPEGNELLPVLTDLEWLLIQNRSADNKVLRNIYNSINPLVFVSKLKNLKEIAMVSAFRKISDQAEMDYSGGGLIKRLAELKDPDHDKLENREKFNNIVNFLKEILENESVSLSIPYSKDKLNIEMDGRTLPIESFGTGIHELTILSTSATLLENSIICIEEPEIHFHPRLQKSFINYLYDKTTNQYFISTHSNSLMNLPYTSIFYVRLKNGSSVIESAITDRAKFSICEDLGYKASDLLQSNCIIWVEGPSDRIYLNHWINSISPNLIESVHYSIMFYGGKLLSHVSSKHEEVESFIKLRSINRKMCVVMDSDKKDSSKTINETKKRIQEEYCEGPGFAWITYGREIENYIDPDVMEQTIKEIYGNDAKLLSKDQYSNLWKFKKDGDSNTHEAEKLKIAHKLSERPVNLNIFDLRDRITELVKFISDSNS